MLSRIADCYYFLAHLSWMSLVSLWVCLCRLSVCMYICLYVCTYVLMMLSTFSNIFSSETTWPIETKFQVKPSWDGETKFCSKGPGQMTKMAAMLIYDKNVKNLLLRNQKVNDLETWYTALGARVQMMTLDWLWLILWQGHICFFQP